GLLARPFRRFLCGGPRRRQRLGEGGVDAARADRAGELGRGTFALHCEVGGDCRAAALARDVAGEVSVTESELAARARAEVDELARLAQLEVRAETRRRRLVEAR